MSGAPPEPPELEDLFGSAPDERAVLSVCAARCDASSPWTLVHATLLIVPPGCSERSWPAWPRLEGDPHPTTGDLVLPADTVVEGDRWLLGRAVLDRDQAQAWFSAVWERTEAGVNQVLPVAGGLPPLESALVAPRAVARVFPSVDSAASSLICGLGRPVEAVIWPNSTNLTVTRRVLVASTAAA